MKNCLVVFPLYKQPTVLELSFLENGLEKTSNFDHVIVAPQSLEINAHFGNLNSLKVIRFENFYFESLFGYNQLMLSAKFYQKFSDYKYILIHQSDVFLFQDNLAEWCNKGYDYIGAPWFRPEKLNQTAIQKWLSALKTSLFHHKKYNQRHNKCGNGGLSLRKVSTALQVLKDCPKSLLNKYYYLDKACYNEDIFWSLEAPALVADFKIPDLEEGLQFAFEFKPKEAFALKAEQLPFGCHAPLKHEPAFWSKYIPSIKQYAVQNRILINMAVCCIEVNS
ncbi:MAG: hypothetical protein EOO99_02175 [Pedobacter sp.]|nr:MAG: hypothetical protein EOO99_02175 [Pedobacter sp.]